MIQTALCRPALLRPRLDRRAPRAGRIGPALAIAVVSCFGPSVAAAEKCTTEYRELAGTPGMPRVREHVCPLQENPGSPALRVTFLRLNEALAGSLVHQGTVPEIDRLFGETRTISNDVGKELERIFRFARVDNIPEDNIKFTVTATAAKEKASDEGTVDLPAVKTPNQEVRRIWTISAFDPKLDQMFEVPISVPAALDAVYKSRRWPADFKQFYDCLDKAIQCTTLWRYVKKLQELDTIERDTDRMARKEGSRFKADEQEEWDQNVPQFVYKKHFALLRYLGHANWPSDFLVITSSYPKECGDRIVFAYLMPPFGLDAALIENPTAQPVRIRDLVGTSQKDQALRLAASASAPSGAAAPLGQGELVVPPGKKIIVPLRIVIMVDHKWPVDTANKMYQQIKSKPSRSVFVLTASESLDSPAVFRIRKERDSFLPPEVPARHEFEFGPAVRLSGLLLEKQDDALGEPELNLLSFSKSSEADVIPDETPPEPDVELGLNEHMDVGGSCPILYTWDDRLHDWINRGKVIHAAYGADKETTSTVEVGVDVRRFRLSEEEPEVSFIRRVQLILDLRDGARVSIDPVGESPFRDRFRFKIPAYTRTDFRFDVPPEYEKTGILHAEIAVTGYYRRYSEIMVSRLLESLDRRH